MTPRCAECGSTAWSQRDSDPLVCLRCGSEWLVAGMHGERPTGESVLVLAFDLPKPVD